MRAATPPTTRTGRLVPAVAAALAFFALVPGGHAAETATIQAGPNTLQVTLPPWEGLKPDVRLDDQLRAWWFGQIGRSRVDVEVRIYPREAFFLDVPEDVTEYAAGILRLPERQGDARFAFTSCESVPGPYGWIPRAVLARGPLPCPQRPAGELLMLSGILEEHGYEVSVTAQPPLASKDREAVLAFLVKGVRAKSAVRDPQWTPEEIQRRWQADVTDPKVRAQLRPVVRTDHYLVMTNASTGKAFAKRMEEGYRKVQRAYSFPEAEDRRLLPVFLFRLPVEYHAFHVHVTRGTMQEAKATTRLALRDFYATSCAAASDPAQLHEVTHQLCAARLRLSGGGPWFQEGVAEYVSTKPGKRKAWTKNAVKRGTYQPFRTFFATPSLLAGPDAKDATLQAASIIGFLRDGRLKRAAFPEFVRRVGLAPENNVEALDHILGELYGLDVDGLEERWKAYGK